MIIHAQTILAVQRDGFRKEPPLNWKIMFERAFDQIFIVVTVASLLRLSLLADLINHKFGAMRLDVILFRDFIFLLRVNEYERK